MKSVTSCLLENHFRPQERLEEVEPERYNMEFLYSGYGTASADGARGFEGTVFVSADARMCSG